IGYRRAGVWGEAPPCAALMKPRRRKRTVDRRRPPHVDAATDAGALDETSGDGPSSRVVAGRDDDSR
ncbi:MAG TPA: hypothetical protein VMT69_07995, partial [Kineosporiaceae bacterium]|nr:hypothetical protein [Kineosporiaceae bacterium]